VKANDESQSPVQPQYQLGATSDEAKMSAQIARSPIPGPGGIVSRLENQQWQFPRAQTDSEISRDTHGLPNG
jgi:hypothetical protein